MDRRELLEKLRADCEAGQRAKPPRTTKGKRCHRKTFYLNDAELELFEQARKADRMNESEFMRRRCLASVKRKQASMSQIEVYRCLGELQQQIESVIAQAGNSEDLQQGLKQVLEGIKSLRRAVVDLETVTGPGSKDSSS